MAKLDGKVAVITGASSGIGEATAEALAAEGAAVVVAARREDRLNNLVDRIEGDGGRVLPVACDVTDEEQAHALIQRAKDELGSVDILVNNAGVMQLSKIEKGLSDEWRTMFDVNVMGLLYVTDAAVQAMKEQGSGYVVNISSVAGRKTRPGVGVYSGTKFAVNAISEALRQELIEDNVRVTMIEPGAVETELPNHITDEEAKEGIDALYQLDDILQAEDIANAIVYCVTQPARVSINELLIRPTQQAN
ncbi:MAG TPA: SDR family NAD(P)-dependent oxidoreductase [Rubrobacteraceae bacterium]|jgi:NADP-dependent 3-hydroxy acid dehydrogenase YdfG|nr:SDR family NAD(P)-dependent oxidoreductase [Rubrobacteraceae bacterium]